MVIAIFCQCLTNCFLVSSAGCNGDGLAETQPGKQYVDQGAGWEYASHNSRTNGYIRTPW